MWASALITFRETLEAALVVSIIITFLIRTKQAAYMKQVFWGVGGGIVLSVVLAILLQVIFGGLKGRSEAIYEGMLMFVTAGFISWMILWVHRQKEVVKKMHKDIARHVGNAYPLGLVLLTTTSIMREGVETVLYLNAAAALGVGHQLLGAVLGVVVALVLAYGIFRYSLKVNIRHVLKLSGALLLLFAAGLVSHGVHEFQEAGLLPIFAFDPMINISHVLDNGSTLGSILRTLFGYTAKPTMLEMLSYAFYITFIFILELITDKRLALKHAKVPQKPKR